MDLSCDTVRCVAAMDSEDVNGFRWPGLPKEYLLKSFVSCLSSVSFVAQIELENYASQNCINVVKNAFKYI